MRSAADSPNAPSVRDELSRGAARLASAGCQTPRLDAELLLAEVLGVTRAGLVMAAGEPVADGALGAFRRLLERRAAREPVAYILGRRSFRRLELEVDRRVLIPRPESELLVEVGLEVEGGARVADVGTGSGAVALALKDERPDLRVTGIDVSEDVLAVARANGERLGLDVRWVLGDLLNEGTLYDAVLANLPYVADGARLEPEILDWEPSGALFAGGDGLDVVRRLVAEVADRDDVRLLALEVGFDQARAVSELVEAAGFASVERRRDLAGHERVVVGRR
jgi:release factor glutamine methyltransferase